MIALGRETVVGRQATGARLLHGKGLSRAHARFLRRLDGSVTVIDTGSTNGIVVDGQRVETAPLHEGSTVQLGADVVLVLEFRRLGVEVQAAALTAREHEIAFLVSTGLNDTSIATRLGITRRTTTTHVSRILSKLGLANRLELIQRAQGVVD